MNAPGSKVCILNAVYTEQSCEDYCAEPFDTVVFCQTRNSTFYHEDIPSSQEFFRKYFNQKIKPINPDAVISSLSGKKMVVELASGSTITLKIAYENLGWVIQ